MITINTTERQTLADRMKGQTERFLERASRSGLDARVTYERLVRRLHGLEQTRERGEVSWRR
jgi:hypothetical protein